MSDYQEIDPARAAQITERIGQTFDFVRDVLEDPDILDAIPAGSTLRFRDVETDARHYRLVAYAPSSHALNWVARITSPADVAWQHQRPRWPDIATRGMGGKWGSPPTAPESGSTPKEALDALEAKLRDADHSRTSHRVVR